MKTMYNCTGKILKDFSEAIMILSPMPLMDNNLKGPKDILPSQTDKFHQTKVQLLFILTRARHDIQSEFKLRIKSYKISEKYYKSYVIMVCGCFT